MNITYTQNGDYLIPNIIIRKTKPLGHYGRLRKAYLKMHRPILFNELALSDKLFEHCAEIDEAARSRMELIVRSLAEQNGVTEQLKAMCGLRYQVRDVDEALARLPIDMCFGTLKREEILKCLFNFESGFSDG